MEMIDCKIFFLLLMSSLTAPTVKDSHIESRFLLAIFKKRSKTNLKPF